MSTKLSCKEILEKLSEYIDEELDPSLCDEIDGHMGDCPPCVAFMNTLKKTVKLFNKAGQEVSIPGDVQSRLHDFLRENCTDEKN